ncbi:HET-domain-containing protein [Curvularia clavata]|uniref:HET-domain-containing protein n=1 Tax=Curvularia clavata TaxID=95742 RepID=A0A9Q9DQX0_CURCL|nr:HET-domain-containing protein [Curvularia clavata]
MDWKAQASMMRLVYQNACCNIAATWAADGDDGCFTTGGSQIITLDLGHGESTKHQLFSRFLYHDDNTEAPLNTRGWVAQERYLARRQLNFAKSQVYWECRELIASEQFPAGIPEPLRDFLPYNQASPPNGKPTLAYTSEEERRQAWAALVDFYSNCNFSRLSDKMIALTGLAEDMRHAMGDVYLAGLWKKDLHKQLCWSTDFDVRARVNRSRTPTYLAPTWSWASVDGPVMSDQAYYIANMEVSLCIEILDASILSRHSSGLHSFVASSLVLRGIAFWAQAIMLEGYVDGLWELQFTDLDKIPYCLMNMHVSIHWDENMSGSEENPERWPSFLEERNSNLLLQQGLRIVYIKDLPVLRRVTREFKKWTLYLRISSILRDT